ncbi:GntR family transcriptional regulator [Pandoraea sp.]|uniref:GntR family transcriptional regulator n=1 Tax=Pandoraea sp. TaxID=1883445 RepID=UPI0012152088|nr:GntR family transcriptional regulator [Pandoraea sp.]TAL56443.1 MAG: GntR family transcriptional regulator [Pandoraea sp.]TAM15262.1 MAG: GntR family transcriptional regulator [Pandoraea sp.]
MPANFSPASLTATLPIQIAEQIGTAIMEEQFAPGERIREVSLAASFNVSRATVRDALRILESRGLVRILPQRGAQVTLLSSQELQNLFEIRAVLLALASRRAAGNFRAEDAPRLKAALAQLKATLNDAKGYARASAAMVTEVAALSGSEQLSEMITGFAQRIGRYARLGLVTQKRRNRSLSNWTALVAAIIAKNEELAEATHRRLALENRDAAMEEIEARAKAGHAGESGKQGSRKLQPVEER